jgi:hypothetical protein
METLRYLMRLRLAHLLVALLQLVEVAADHHQAVV